MQDHQPPRGTKSLIHPDITFFHFILYSFAYKAATINITLFFDFCFNLGSDHNFYLNKVGKLFQTKQA